ncbi:VOC family protein [Streptomyces meridianus]|nr:VOC family protein [Streptomyces meridianus]
MSTRTSTRAIQGAPCWVSLMARDLDATQDFYGSVLGWTYRGSSAGADVSVALADGRPVAGINALAPSMGVPVAWTAYFSAPNADIVAARIRERGATVGVGPLAFGAGRAALASDPAGAVFGFWEGPVQAGWRVGAANAPAALELHTRDAFAAAVFYGELFDWASGLPDTCTVSYEHETVLVLAEGRTVASLMGGGIEAAPDPQVRPRWHVFFWVSDVDAAARAAVRGGGTVVSGPQDARAGRAASLRDPDGALFAVTSGQA